jgi:hypothetical protein
VLLYDDTLEPVKKLFDLRFEARGPRVTFQNYCDGPILELKDPIDDNILLLEECLEKHTGCVPIRADPIE